MIYHLKKKQQKKLGSTALAIYCLMEFLTFSKIKMSLSAIPQHALGCTGHTCLLWERTTSGGAGGTRRMAAPTVFPPSDPQP